MTLKEAANLVAWAVANFPALQERDMRPTAELWARVLSDIPYDVAEAALLQVLTGARYFPSVAEIRQAAVNLMRGQAPAAVDAWGEVQAAIRRYGYYREAEALTSMSPEVAHVVRAIGWQEICASQEPDVVRGQFRRAYEEYVTRRQAEAVMPDEVKRLREAALKALPKEEPA